MKTAKRRKLPSRFEISRLRAQPGDMLVIRVGIHTSVDQLESISKELRKFLPPDVKWAVIRGDVSLSVLTKERA